MIELNENGFKVGVSNKDGQLGFLYSRGGLREGAGRKSIGATKKISLTLPDDIWEKLEKQGIEHRMSRSEVLRQILESYYSS
ncbi:ribbon-helix-helix domain-containing protein [Cohnella nanjingensis]|uniref:Ribbon-helix-helix protein, CopG family n=1 Tax=Cohnella nanjingensis TaxID=1387779 RepID=A0A7X0RQU1_9BACL|nr:CopG family transcriptional regulator [Cohnella nanjingensis]MBB6672014.1 ribbon-helix-helix protein, CopG family [Cohnella nanjingensis]